LTDRRKLVDLLQILHTGYRRHLDKADRRGALQSANHEGVKRWFDAVTELWVKHQYTLSHVYNMDKTGFAVGASQSLRALVNIRDTSSWKQTGSRQEWITAIECVSASSVAIPPLLIFKAKHTNTRWIPTQAPQDWRFSEMHTNKQELICSYLNLINHFKRNISYVYV
jgi:hypothetical protein